MFGALTVVLDGTSALARNAFEVHSPSFGAPRLLPTPTRPAELCIRIDIALCDFIPPLLLPCCPHLIRTAAGALERLVCVVAALHESRHSVAIVRGESCNVHAHEALCSTFRTSLPLPSFLTTDHGPLVSSNVTLQAREFRASPASDCEPRLQRALRPTSV